MENPSNNDYENGDSYSALTPASRSSKMDMSKLLQELSHDKVEPEKPAENSEQILKRKAESTPSKPSKDQKRKASERIMQKTSKHRGEIQKLATTVKQDGKNMSKKSVAALKQKNKKTTKKSVPTLKQKSKKTSQKSAANMKPKSKKVSRKSQETKKGRTKKTY